LSSFLLELNGNAFALFLNELSFLNLFFLSAGFFLLYQKHLFLYSGGLSIRQSLCLKVFGYWWLLTNY